VEVEVRLNTKFASFIRYQRDSKHVLQNGCEYYFNGAKMFVDKNTDDGRKTLAQHRIQDGSVICVRRPITVKFQFVDVSLLKKFFLFVVSLDCFGAIN
jgi:hypothetical protein